jgi:dTDP-4-dehydrorhamnose reductase
MALVLQTAALPMRAVITGATGNLGTALRALAEKRQEPRLRAARLRPADGIHDGAELATPPLQQSG